MVKLSGKVKANTSGGSLAMKNSKANFDASTSGGGISMENIDGILNVSTSGGSIEADGTQPKLKGSTNGGSIHLNNVKGETEVNTSGGSISLDNMEGSVVGETSGGGISANINKLSTKLILSTNGGNIDATIPAGLGFNLDLSADKIDTKLTSFKGTSKKDKIQGQMNGGGILVQLSTSSGSISLDYK